MTLIFSTSLFTSIRAVDFTQVARQETGISVVQALDSEGEFPKYPKRMILTPRRNVNIPWPDQGMGDGDYMYAFQEVVMPIAQEFDPDLVISKQPLSYRYTSSDLDSCGWLRCCSR
jgi:hypothetical protein